MHPNFAASIGFWPPTNLSFFTLDFPINKKTFNLINELDEITVKFGGRFYLAKDSRMSAEIFNKSDNRIKEFISFREKKKLIKNFNSTQSNRLGI